MITRDQVIGHHSPAAWGLAAIAAAAVLEVAGVIAWNVWDRRHELLEQARGIAQI